MMKGLGEIKENLGKSVDYVKLKSGEAIVFRIAVTADEIIGVYEHVEQIGGQWKTLTCLGKNVCPMCAAGKKASFKAYIPIINIATDKVQIFKASKDTVKDILGLVEEYGDLTKRDFKMVRQGEKLDTRYQFFPKDPREMDLSGYEIPDIEDRVKPLNREAFLAIMDGGISTSTATTSENTAGDKSNEDDGYPF